MIIVPLALVLVYWFLLLTPEARGGHRGRHDARDGAGALLRTPRRVRAPFAPPRRASRATTPPSWRSARRSRRPSTCRACSSSSSRPRTAPGSSSTESRWASARAAQPAAPTGEPPADGTAPSGEPPQSAPGQAAADAQAAADTASTPPPTADRRRDRSDGSGCGRRGRLGSRRRWSRVRLDGVQVQGRLLRARRLLPPAEALRLRRRRQGARARSPDDDRRRRVHRRARDLPGARGDGARRPST